jgi:hypothetical protein
MFDVGARLLALVGERLAVVVLDDGGVLGCVPGLDIGAGADEHGVVQLFDRGTMLANLGYFGHTWELYAVWAWIPDLAASFAASGDPAPTLAALLAFGTIAVGGVGALVAGVFANRIERTTVTSGSMIVSGAACIGAGFVFAGPLLVLVPFLLL